MTAFLGVLRYEYTMSVRRWGIWLAFALAASPFALDLPSTALDLATLPTTQVVAGFALMLNLLIPVVGGIVLADRLTRDSQLGIQELLFSTPVRRHSYIVGKYLGAVLSTLTPVFAVWVLVVLGFLVSGAPGSVAGLALLSFLTINAPALAFVGAFSVACPAVLPVRIYQVLFTGYWFWGNFLSPEFLPTISGTILNASGGYVASGFFGLARGTTALGEYSGVEAALNLLVLGLLAGLALYVLDRLLAWRASRA